MYYKWSLWNIHPYTVRTKNPDIFHRCSCYSCPESNLAQTFANFNAGQPVAIFIFLLHCLRCSPLYLVKILKALWGSTHWLTDRLTDFTVLTGLLVCTLSTKGNKVRRLKRAIRLQYIAQVTLDTTYLKYTSEYVILTEYYLHAFAFVTGPGSFSRVEPRNICWGMLIGRLIHTCYSKLSISF